MQKRNKYSAGKEWQDYLYEVFRIHQDQRNKKTVNTNQSFWDELEWLLVWKILELAFFFIWGYACISYKTQKFNSNQFTN